MQHTENLNLNLMEAADPFSPTPLNENARALERALGEVAAKLPRFAAGGYVGTGTYGSGKPNALAFDFDPKLVVVVGKDGFALFPAGAAHGGGLQYGYTHTNFYLCGVTLNAQWGDKALSWYAAQAYTPDGSLSANAYYQLNAQDQPYSWIAIG